MVTLSYIKYVTPSGSMPPSVLLLQYGPLYLLLAGGYIFRRAAYKNRRVTLSLRQKQRYFLEDHS
jgi:hypothetical protein